MVKLNSGIQRELVNDFVLDEDGIRRIVGILEAKSLVLPYECTVVLVIRREDDRFYETVNIEDVLNDANMIGHLIQKFSIELRITDSSHKPEPWDRNWLVQVVYEKKARLGVVQINVQSEDRNWALLLADELEPQVVRTLATLKISTWVLLIFYIPLATFIITCAKNYFPQFGVPSDIIGYVITGTCVGTIFLCVATIEGDDGRAKWLSKWVGPDSSFSWGDQIKSFQLQQERLKNLFWVVIIGLTLSIVATVYTSVMLPTLSQGGNAIKPPLQPFNTIEKPHG